MTELDEKAIQKATRALYEYRRTSSPESMAHMKPWSDEDEMGWQAVTENDVRCVLSALLAAAPAERETGEQP